VETILLTYFTLTSRAAARKHTMVGQKYLRGEGKHMFREEIYGGGTRLLLGRA